MKRNRKYWKDKCQGSSQRKLDHRDRGNAGLYGGRTFWEMSFRLELFPGEFYAGESQPGQIFVFVVSLIAMVFGTGYSYMMLNMSRGREFRLGNLLYMFHNQPDRVLIAAFVMALLNTVSQLPIYFAVYLANSRKHDRSADVTGCRLTHGNHDPECSTECTYHGTACAQFLSSGR